MARILLGWELGAGRGHSTRLVELAGLLEKRGHTPLFAVQQMGPFAAHGPTWQAPLWPGLLRPRPFDRPPATMGDMLAHGGMVDTEAVAAMLQSWNRILADARPDAVVAEYAPILQIAARSRAPVLAWGTGFTLPPHQLSEFPTLTGCPAVIPELALLAALNDGLRLAGREPLAALPRMFAADRHLVSAFEEFDPYREWRDEPAGVSAVAGAAPVSDGSGDELFVYFNGKGRRPNAFWQGLASSGLRVRVHDPLMNEAVAATLEQAGMRVEREPVPFPEIVARSRLLISHGGLGVISSALLAGLPQIAIPFDLEKKLNSDALVRTELGLSTRFEDMEADSFARFVRGAWDDAGLRTRAREAAPGFRARMTKSAEEEAAELVEKML